MRRSFCQAAAAMLFGAAIGYLLAGKYKTEREIHLFDCRMKEWKRRSEHRERV